jgi:hypothetical protein
MAVVTIDAAAQVARSSGATGWSARGTFEVPDLDVSQLAHTTATAVGNISTQTRVAQSFTTGSAYSLAAVRILIQKNTAPTDNWSVEIYADASNLPTGAALATSDLIASADISTTIHWHEFVFSSPPSLSSGTKYWIALKRSGALDASNYLQWRLSTASSYASGGRSVDNAGVWGAESAASDQAFETVKTTKSLYQVTQDTGGSPEFHMYRSTDNAASWSEVDTGNGPTVFNTAYPWSADWAKAGLNNTGEGNAIVLAYFTNTNTMRARAFNIGSQTWATADLNAADATTAAVNTRPVRMILNSIEQQIFFTATADDADISRAQRLAAAWQATAIYFAATSANQSSLSDMVKDRTSFGAASSTGRFLTGFVYDAAGGDDFSVQTVTSSTNGTITDLDAAAAVGSSKHASATYHTYSGAGGVDTVIAAYIDSDDTLQERTAQLEVTAASITFGTQHQVTATTSYAGRQLSTCKFGSDLYVFASTGTGIDYYKDTGASGTWGSVNNWKSGLTNCFLSQATPVTGVGIIVVYNDNGDVKCDIAEAVGGGGAASLTVGAATATAQGEAVTFDAASKLTVTEATAPAAGQAVILKGQGTLGVTVATAPAAGEAVTFDAASLFTVAPATAPAAGEAVTLKGQARLAVTEATAPAAGEDVTLDAAAKLTVTEATAPAQGEAVNLAAAMAASLTVTPATAPATGENVALKGQGALAVTVATAPAAGEAVTFDAAAKLTVTEATAPAAGEAVNFTAGVVAALTVTPATAPAQGEAVTLDAAAKLTVDAATAPAQGEAVTLDVAANLIAGTATAPAAGQAVTLYGQGRLALDAAPAPAEGEGVTLYGGTSIPASLTVAPATAPAQAEAVTFDAAAVFAVTTATAPAQGEAVKLTATALMAIAAAVADATGLNVSLTGHGTLAIAAPSSAPAAADGAFTGVARFVIDAALAGALADVDLVGAVPGDIDARLLVASPLTATLQVIRILTGYTNDTTTVTARTEADYGI